MGTSTFDTWAAACSARSMKILVCWRYIGSSLGRRPWTFFLPFYNDVASNVKSEIRLFAKGCVIYEIFETACDMDTLQRDLNMMSGSNYRDIVSGSNSPSALQIIKKRTYSYSHFRVPRCYLDVKLIWHSSSYHTPNPQKTIPHST